MPTSHIVILALAVAVALALRAWFCVRIDLEQARAELWHAKTITTNTARYLAKHGSASLILDNVAALGWSDPEALSRMEPYGGPMTYSQLLARFSADCQRAGNGPLAMTRAEGVAIIQRVKGRDAVTAGDLELVEAVERFHAIPKLRSASQASNGASFTSAA